MDFNSLELLLHTSWLRNIFREAPGGHDTNQWPTISQVVLEMNNLLHPWCSAVNELAWRSMSMRCWTTARPHDKSYAWDSNGWGMIVSGVIISCEDRNLHHGGVVHGCTAASHAYTTNSTPLPAASPAFQTGVNTSIGLFSEWYDSTFSIIITLHQPEKPISKPISPRQVAGPASLGVLMDLVELPFLNRKIFIIPVTRPHIHGKSRSW